jgi:hypothetical protein
LRARAVAHFSKIDRRRELRQRRTGARIGAMSSPEARNRYAVAFSVNVRCSSLRTILGRFDAMDLEANAMSGFTTTRCSAS